MVEQLIFTDAAAVAGVPIPYLTLNTVGPTIMRYGTDEQKEYFLPRILAGELHFSIGYSEPGSGTDLASPQDPRGPRGRRVGDQRAEDVDLPDPVRRLDLAGLPHRPGPPAAQGTLDDPGARPTPTASPTPPSTPSPGSAPARRTTRTCGCRSSNLVGELNGGWSLMTNQLNHERVALTSAAPLTHSLELVRALGAGDQEPGRPAGDRPASGCRSRSAGRTPGSRCSRCSTGSSPPTVERPLPRRRLGHQGLRLGARHRGLPLADGDRRPERAGSPATPTAPCWPAGSSATTAPRW